MSRGAGRSARPAEPATAWPDPPQPPEVFAREIARIGLDPDAAVNDLSRYLAELDAWRRRINLTGRLSTAELVQHALEALPAASLIAEGKRVVDIGSGAGFPAIPLAILHPGVMFALFEPTAKKAAFLRHVARVLPLPNVSVHAARIQDADGQAFDAATTRAVGDPAELFGSAAFLRPGGALLAWTTDAGALASELPDFRLRETLPIPGSRSKAIAVLVKLPADVPRGTSGDR